MTRLTVHDRAQLMADRTERGSASLDRGILQTLDSVPHDSSDHRPHHLYYSAVRIPEPYQMDPFTKVRSHAGMRGASYYAITHDQNTSSPYAGFLRVWNGGADAA